MNQTSWKTPVAALLLFAFASCSDSNDTPAPNQTARVMVVHASPNAPNVDVRVNNSVALTNVPFLANSSYTAVPAGNTNIKVSPTGTTTYVIDANVNLAANTSYSVFAVDSVSKIKAAAVVDDLTVPASGKAHIRFFHFSPNAPAVTVRVVNGPALFSNRSFNDQATNAAVASFTPVDAATYNLEVVLAGTNTVVLPLPGVALTAGKIYTVYAKGFVGGSGNQALGAQLIANN
jgi:hypothetical protein